MSRGICSLDRGKGQRKLGHKRATCPTCDKKGLGPFKVEVSVLGSRIVRHCRYCQHLQFKTYMIGRDYVITDVQPAARAGVKR